MKTKNPAKGLAIAGLVVGIVGTVCSITALFFSAFAMINSNKE